MCSWIVLFPSKIYTHVKNLCHFDVINFCRSRLESSLQTLFRYIFYEQMFIKHQYHILPTTKVYLLNFILYNENSRDTYTSLSRTICSFVKYQQSYYRLCNFNDSRMNLIYNQNF